MNRYMLPSDFQMIACGEMSGSIDREVCVVTFIEDVTRVHLGDKQCLVINPGSNVARIGMMDLHLPGSLPGFLFMLESVSVASMGVGDFQPARRLFVFTTDGIYKVLGSHAVGYYVELCNDDFSMIGDLISNCLIGSIGLLAV